MPEIDPLAASDIFGPERDDLFSVKPTLAIPISKLSSSENFKPESFLP